MSEHILTSTAAIVSAYLANNKLLMAELPGFITSTFNTLSGLGKDPVPAIAAPKVPIKKSIGTDTVTCLECGMSLAMLKRHLRSEHDLTPEAYRARFGLAFDHPLVAPNYAKTRSELAKASGLGKRDKPVIAPAVKRAKRS